MWKAVIRYIPISLYPGLSQHTKLTLIMSGLSCQVVHPDEFRKPKVWWKSWVLQAQDILPKGIYPDDYV